jgi:hypothetical protein
LSKKIFADSRLLAARNLEREYFPLLIADPGECPPIKAFEVFIHETIYSGEDVLRFENKYSGCDVLPWH